MSVATDARPVAHAASNRRRRGGRALKIYTALVIAYLFLPIGVMILFGFNDHAGRFNFTWQGFTIDHYKNLGEFPDLIDALKNSLLVAAISTLAATALGTAAALALTRYRFRGRSATNLFIFLPMATPEIVLGASLLSLFVTANVSRGLATILIAHVMFNISYVVVTVKARTHGFNREWEEAAKDLGATPWTAFRTVTFPLIFPGVLAAAILAFALSVDDFVITTFNAGQTTTFPLWVYGASRLGVPAQVNVMGTIVFFVGVGVALLSGLLERHGGRPPRPTELMP
jgi:spermidine/putrescine transport system permease protein